MAIRVPSWAGKYEGKAENGYAYLDFKDNETKEIEFEMKLRFIQSNPKVTFDNSRYAVSFGPTIYCSEAVDNGENLRDLTIDLNTSYKFEYDEKLGVVCLILNAFRHEETNSLYFEKNDRYIKTKAKLIPYYAFANRGESEMQVWHFVR